MLRISAVLPFMEFILTQSVFLKSRSYKTKTQEVFQGIKSLEARKRYNLLSSDSSSGTTSEAF
jgi:hypothetical protein